MNHEVKYRRAKAVISGSQMKNVAHRPRDQGPGSRLDKLQYFPVKISRRVLGLRSLPSPTKSSHATFCNSKGQTREGKQTWFYFCIIDMTTTLTQLKSQISDEVSIGQIRSQTRSKTGLRLEDKCPCWVKGPTRTSVSVFYIYLPVEVLHSYSGKVLYLMSF